MTHVEFIFFVLEHWVPLVLWSLGFMVSLFLIFRKVVPAKIYDPFHIVVAFNCGSAYGVVTSLYQYDYINTRLFSMVMISLVLLLGLVFVFLKKRVILFPHAYKLFLMPVGNGRSEAIVISVLYTFFALLLIASTGFGAFTDTNRFEQVKGIGFIVRFLDLFRLILLGLYMLYIFKIVRPQNNRIKTAAHWLLLAVFLLFTSLLSGAKFAMLEGMYVMFVCLYTSGQRIRMTLFRVVLLLISTVGFAMAILALNIKNKPEAEETLYSDKGNVVAERFMHRILSNGETYFMSLPGGIIDQVQRDNAVVRFASQILGMSLTSRIMGYNVVDYTVGRAVLLYHDPGNEISGGPTSRFDLFGYVYFGKFFFVYILAIAVLLASIANALKKAPQNFFYISVMSALWLRTLQVLIEPPAGIAYFVDTFLIIFVIKVMVIATKSFIEKTKACVGLQVS